MKTAFVVVVLVLSGCNSQDPRPPALGFEPEIVYGFEAGFEDAGEAGGDVADDASAVDAADVDGPSDAPSCTAHYVGGVFAYYTCDDADAFSDASDASTD